MLNHFYHPSFPSVRH